ncbi:autotransporter-associated beta strand repeat-containing protein [Aquabacter sp. CN5-332]|uniref:autotransporter-associated beta strand repeat-containing protein n=1 Tax=Aquabacter sp. CN5-332 TaxID=3156608 RepID=UPI0032B3D3FE
MSLALLTVAPAHAQEGPPWVGDQGINVPAGPGFPGGVGGGGPKGIGEGGGGGGAGTTGGMGGNASVINSEGPLPGHGGAGGTAAGSSGIGGAGQPGIEGADGGSGGGGGGGAHGYMGNGAPPTVALGGDGGEGASGTKGKGPGYDTIYYFAGGGGSGGNGGYGATITPNGSAPVVINLPVTGGEGGDGGNGATYIITHGEGIPTVIRGAGGSGGNGGTGLFLSGNSATLVINGDVEGGSGGSPGGGGDYGDTGAGGTGLIIAGDNNSITITANGSVTGGLSGDPFSTDHADAVDINGFNNTLTLEAGFVINGDVNVVSGQNTLAFGGTAPGSFDVSQIGNGFNNFTKYAVTGGSWTLTNTNQNPLAWVISGGTMSISQGGTLGGFGSTLALNGPGTLQTTASMTIGGFSVSSTTPLSAPQIEALAGTTLTVNGPITGGSALSFTGQGTVNLTGANTFTGTFDVEAGTLVAGAAGAFNNNIGVSVAAGANFTLNTVASINSLAGGGSVNLGSNILTVGTSGVGSTFSGTVFGAGILAQQGTGALTLQGAQLGMGTLAINGGTVTLTGGTVVQAGVALTLASGTLNMGQSVAFASIDGSGAINNGGNLLTVTGAAASTFSGTIAGAGGLTQAGSGTLRLSGVNTYTGITNVTAGTLLLSGGQAIADSGAVFVGQGGTLQLGASETFNALSGAGAVVLGGNALTLGANGGNATFSGGISGGALVKVGGGTQTLTGPVSLSAGLTISGGTVQLGDGATSGSLTGNVVNNSTLAVMPGGNTVLQGTITGTGALSITAGGGAVYLTADNNYTGGTTINSGSLFLGNGGTAGSIVGNVLNNGTLVFNTNTASTFNGVISGSGQVAFQAGTTTLAGVNSYSGGTLISSGATAIVSSDANLGAASGRLGLAGGTLSAAASFASARNLELSAASAINVAPGVTLALSGTANEVETSSLTKTGAGMLTLSGTNRYTGGTQINGGTLLVSADANLGAAIGGVGINGGMLSVNESFTSARAVTLGALGGIISTASGTTLTLSGAITGSGGLTVAGAGTVALTGTSSISGPTAVSGGTLALYGGSLTTAGLAVASGSALVGYGTIGSDVQVSSGATLHGGVTSTDNPLRSPLFTDNLNLAAGSSTILTLGTLANSGVAHVNGNLSASGTLTVAGDAVYGAGYYRAFTYTGALSNALTLGSVPVGYTGQIDTSNAGQVNVVLRDLSPFQIWSANGVTLGGSGTWSSTSVTWNEPAAGVTIPWGGEVGIFTGTAGTVAVQGRQSFEKLEFVTSGFVLTADPSRADSGLAFNNGGVLWVEGYDVTATIGAPIGGTGGLKKIGAGTLVLTGTNTYTGGTFIDGGILKVSADGALGGAGEGVTLSRGELSASSSFSTARAITLDTRGTLSADGGATFLVSGSISGNGALRKDGDGTVVLSGSNTYGGDTVITGGTLLVQGGSAIPDASNVTVEAAGRLALGASETIGSLSGAGRVDLSSNTLSISSSASTVFHGTITGTGRLMVAGGVLSLTGESTYTGGTSLSGATLVVGQGGTTGSIRGDVVDNGVLAFYRSDTVTFDGAISGAGAVAQVGTGTLILTGANSYTGGTLVSKGGAIQVSANANLGSDRSTLTLEGGTLAITGSFATSRAVELEGGGIISVSGGAQLTLNGPVTGTDGLDKTGAGTLILAGTNSYSGGTVIAEGRLQVGNGGTTGTLSGDVVNNGTLAFNRADTISFGGQVSGSGSLAQLGPGTLTLTAANTYTGDTVVGPKATLAVSSDANLGNAVSVVRLQGGTLSTTASFESERHVAVNTGTIHVAEGVALALRGTISGDGGFSKTGAGSLLLSGENTYEGGTRLLHGVLSVSSDANLGARSGGLFIDGGTLSATSGFKSERAVALGEHGGTFNVQENKQLTLSGAVSGPGTLWKSGQGSLVLTGGNSYMGGIVIAAGTLAGHTASIIGNVLNNGELLFDQNSTGAYSSTVSGTGGVTKAGSGTVILTGTFNQTGGTLISQGTLQVGDGGTSGWVNGPIVNYGTLAYDLSSTYIFPQLLSGTGGVTLQGGGTALFNGSTYTGTVTLNGANVQLSPGVSTPVAFIIGAGSMLGGTGTIGQLTVGNGGTVSPGYSPGALSVAGNAVFQGGSAYRAEVQPSNINDLISVAGSVQINPGSTVQVVGGRGSYANSWTFTILTAEGGVTGSFSSASSNFAFLDPLLTYGANYVDMTLVRNNIPFAAEAYTFNERSTAAGTESLHAGNPIYDAMASQLKGEAFAAFDALSGEIYASAAAVMQQQSVYTRDAVGARLRQAFGGAAPVPLPYAAGGPQTADFGGGLAMVMWMQAFGGWGDTFSNGNAATISNSIGGAIGGVDAAVGENWRIGAYGGFSQSWFDVSDRNSSGSMDNYDLGLYAGAQYGPIALRLGAGYAWHDVSVSRTVAFPGYTGANSSDYSAGTAQLFGEIAYDVPVAGIAFEPFAGLAYLHLDGGSATETGSSSALVVDGGSMDTLYSTLGVRGATTVSLAGRTFTPNFVLGWQHAFGDTTPEAVMTYASGSSPFTILGAPIAVDALAVGVGLTYDITSQARLSVKYDGLIASSATQNAVVGQFQVKF